jgi:hypothetical protein
MKLLAIILFVVAVSAEKARFDNYRVYQVKIENEDQYQIMKYLEENSDAVSEYKLNFS